MFESRTLKRFTETTKWRDPWFRKLSGSAKLLWEYLRDNCDAIGLIEIDFTLTSQDCGQPIKEKHLAELGDRVQALGNNRFFLPKFIHFQYGRLSPDCPPHKSVLKLVSLHALVHNGLHYSYPNVRVALPYRNGKDKNGMDQEGVQGEPTPRVKDSTIIPESLASSPEFIAVWGRWLSHLKQKRKPATLHAQDLQLLKLAALGPAKAIETLEHCIERNWQGIYEKKEAATNGAPEKPLTMYELQAKLKAKQDRAAALKNRHCSTVAMGEQWDSDASRAEYAGIRKEIRAINQQVENYARH